MPESTAKPTPWSWPHFLLLTVAQLWLAHAVVFFAHEYAHSFTAWILGWKANPLALNYAHPTLKVLLVQLGIDQNVDELRIFASGQDAQAAIISAAGALLGNAVITYSLSRFAYHRAVRRASSAWAMLFYWTTVASLGNFIDYVPIRTFVEGNDLTQDMYAVEQGLHWSPWTLLLVFGVPTAFALVWFFTRIQPTTARWLFPTSAPRRIFLAILTAFVLFDFYGAAGWSSGPIAHTMSVVSVAIIAPLTAAITAFFLSQNHRMVPSNSTKVEIA